MPLINSNTLNEWATGLPDQIMGLLSPLRSKAIDNLTDAQKEKLLNIGLAFGPGTIGSLKGLLAPRTSYEIAHEIASKNAEKMLGLPPGNTAMDRAKAMGFDTNLYHGRYKDYAAPNKTIYATPNPEYASLYTNPSASSMGGKSINDFVDIQPNVMPVMVRSKDILDTTTKQGKKIFDQNFYMQYGNGTPLSNKGYPDWVDAEDFGTMFADKNLPYKGVLADEGAIPMPNGTIQSRGISTAIFDPSGIRSRFAAFDPARAKENDLLAGLAPYLGIGGLLGAGLLTDREKMD